LVEVVLQFAEFVSGVNIQILGLQRRKRVFAFEEPVPYVHHLGTDVCLCASGHHRVERYFASSTEKVGEGCKEA
jgi:hypothetical protein